MDYETLLEEAYNEGLLVKEKPLQYNNGRIKGNRIAIRKDLHSSTEKACVLAEELGHHYTSVGNILDMNNSWNRKQERQARLHGDDKMIGLCGIVSAFKAGCQNSFDIAEYLNVTEEYLQECIACYKEKYGVYTKFDNYLIYFIPVLTVAEMM